MTAAHLALILFAAFVAIASPGPSTLAIAGTSMASGRRCGLAVAAGVTTGSLAWSTVAALGLGAVMAAHVWMFETVRILGAAYLFYLAVRSARSAFSRMPAPVRGETVGSVRAAFVRGLGLHLTNPKPILFFASLYSVGVPPGAHVSALALVIAAVWLVAVTVNVGYALMFSVPRMAAGYARLRGWFEAAFALAFGAASLRILTARPAP